MAIQPDTEVYSGSNEVLGVTDLRSMVATEISDDELVGLGDDLIEFFEAFGETDEDLEKPSNA